jgi:predicted DNA repair protein MutK
MSGLIALLDDVAAIAKVAAASVDDVIGQAAKAGAKAAGAVIDDAAVTPKYVTGFSAERELPIVWRIAKGSFKNKLLYLLPAGMLLSEFAPWLIPPLLILGGAFLCYEGAEKIAHLLGWVKHNEHHGPSDDQPIDPAHLEEQKAMGAIKTDFILSAEIMTIALSQIEADSLVMRAAILAVVAIGITVVVYGSVALIVKADDAGLAMAQRGRVAFIRSLGRGIVAGMPYFLKLLMIVGTAAMLWVGGNIVIHSLHELQFDLLYDWIKDTAYSVSSGFETGKGFIKWLVTAGLDGVFGIILGMILIPIVSKVLAPTYKAITGK